MACCVVDADDRSPPLTGGDEPVEVARGSHDSCVGGGLREAGAPAAVDEFGAGEVDDACLDSFGVEFGGGCDCFWCHCAGGHDRYARTVVVGCVNEAVATVEDVFVEAVFADAFDCLGERLLVDGAG